MSGKIYRFGPFRLDPRSRELHAGDELLAIPPKSFDCLAYLIAHRDRAVGRDELISAVWGTADVSDHSLAQTLLRARQVLGDTGPERTTIRTVPRFGHRWVAPTEVLEAEPSAPPEPAASTPPVERAALVSNARSRIAVVGFAVLALIAMATIFAWRSWLPVAPSALPQAAVAPDDDLFVVMPVNLADTARDDAWVRLGAMYYVSTLLQRNAGRRVLSSDDVVSVVGTAGGTALRDDADLGRVGAVTGASWIVIPRADRTAEGWRFALDVYHGGGMRTYEGSAQAPLPAARAATVAFMAEFDVPVADAPAAPLPADELLQRVDAALLVGDLAPAQALIDDAPEAVRNDPRFRARAGTIALRQGRADDAERLFRPLADDAASPVAVRAHAYVGLGGVLLGRVDVAGAEAAYDKAIAVLEGADEPRLRGRAYMGRGAVHASRNAYGPAMADFGQARIDLQRAGDRIGTANLEINVGMAEVNRGRLEQGIAAFDRAIPILSAFGVRDVLLVCLHNKIYAQFGLLDYPGALATSQRALDLVGQSESRPMARRIGAARARVAFVTGRLAEAESLIARFDTQPDDPARSDTEFAVLRVELLVERGDYAAVEARGDALLDRVARSADATGQSMLSIASWLVVDAASRNGHVEHAERVLARLRAARPAPEDGSRAMVLRLAQARILQARNDPGAAAAFAAAQALVDDEGLPDSVITVATAWLPHLLAAHDVERASALAGRLLAYADRDYRAARAAMLIYRALERRTLAADSEAKMRRLAGERNPDLPL